MTTGQAPQDPRHVYPVVIVDYDARWPAYYEEERARIRAEVGRVFLAIEHVGSTSVPGLVAKPIIDIMATVYRLADAEERIPALEAIGYEYTPPEIAGIPERRYFDKRPPGEEPNSIRGRSTHHLHVVELGGDFWVRHLLFRDWLRTHPADAEAYARLKRELAARFGADREGYTNSKGPFIRSIEERARAERRGA